MMCTRSQRSHYKVSFRKRRGKNSQITISSNTKWQNYLCSHGFNAMKHRTLHIFLKKMPHIQTPNLDSIQYIAQYYLDMKCLFLKSEIRKDLQRETSPFYKSESQVKPRITQHSYFFNSEMVLLLSE